MWLAQVLRMKNDRLPKIVLVAQPSRTKRKVGRLRIGLEDVISKDLREMGTSGKGVKMEALNIFDWRRSVRSWVSLRGLRVIRSSV